MMRCYLYRCLLALVMIISLLSISGCTKQCKERAMLQYPEQMHSYMSAYKPGSWWAYLSDQGATDTVDLFEYIERSALSDKGAEFCYALPERSWVLAHRNISTNCDLFVHYNVGELGGAAICSFQRTEQGPPINVFAYSQSQGYSNCSVVDLVLNGHPKIDLLSVDLPLATEGACPESVYFEKGIGIIAYTLEMDTFHLINSHTP